MGRCCGPQHLPICHDGPDGGPPAAAENREVDRTLLNDILNDVSFHKVPAFEWVMSGMPSV
jgi:hypothetical protein